MSKVKMKNQKHNIFYNMEVFLYYIFTILAVEDMKI